MTSQQQELYESERTTAEAEELASSSGQAGAEPTEPAGERDARIVLSRIAEPGDPVLFAAVQSRGAVRVLDELAGGGLAHPWVARYAARLADTHRDALLAAARAADAEVLCPWDAAWPARLDELVELDGVAAPPLVLWVRGNAGALSSRLAIGMVGARGATAYGTGVATDLAYELTSRGCVVVSGGAYGIDAAAHRAALAAEGLTVAVLGCGIDQAYPAGHANLLAAIAAGGAVISEVPPGTPPSRARFLTRNRLIAGLSDGVVVVEAAVRSGALNTAGWCAQLSRPVMAVPGPVTSQMSAGTHLAIARRGASLVCDAGDVLELMSPSGMAMTAEPRADPRARDLLSAPATAVLEALPSRGAKDAGQLAVAAGLTLDATIAALGLLASDGWVERVTAGWRRSGSGVTAANGGSRDDA